MAFLEAHPGCTRQQVLDGLRAGADPESAEAAELLLHLNNLIANGGAIEFFNATLSLPRGGPRPGDARAEAAPAETGEAVSAEAADEPAEPVREPAAVAAEAAEAESVPEPAASGAAGTDAAPDVSGGGTVPEAGEGKPE